MDVSSYQLEKRVEVYLPPRLPARVYNPATGNFDKLNIDTSPLLERYRQFRELKVEIIEERGE